MHGIYKPNASLPDVDLGESVLEKGREITTA